MRRVVVACAVAVLSLSMQSWAAESAAPAKPDPFRYGGDFRLRQELFNYIPAQAGGYAKDWNNYIRMRTRLWSEYDAVENLTLRVRLANEFRYWNEPDMSGKPDASTYRWPDEVVFDNLSLSLKKLFNDKVDLTIGRQDMTYGNGMLILEGTPADGSRTFYFNAAKAVVKVAEKTTVDVFGIYNPSEDDLAMNPSDRDLNGNGIYEAGGGLYLKNKSIETLPVEGYYIFKREEDYRTAAKQNSDKTGYLDPVFAWQELDEGAGQIVHPALDLHTVGMRLVPKFSESLEGNLEAAFQLGERGSENVHAYGVDAFLKYLIPGAEALKLTLEPGFYYLSGDDPDSNSDEGWNPLWARYPQASDLVVFSYPGARWSNLAMPRARLHITPISWLKAWAGVSYLAAPEDDGPGDGRERGWLYQGKLEFKMGEKLFLPKDKLTGYLLAELFEPGDYYIVDDQAYFVRWEVSYAF